MNRPRKKGTAFETEVLRRLAEAGLPVHRMPAGSVSWDIGGLGFPIEVKHRSRLDIPSWVRAIRRKSDKWCIVIAHGDRREASSIGTVVVCPFEWFVGLVALEHRTAQTGPETVGEAS